MRVVILVLMVSLVAVTALETRAVPNLCRQTCHDMIKDDELVAECKLCCQKCCSTGGKCMMFLFFTGDNVGKRCLYDVDPGNRSDEGISVECKLDDQK